MNILTRCAVLAVLTSASLAQAQTLPSDHVFNKPAVNDQIKKLMEHDPLQAPPDAVISAIEAPGAALLAQPSDAPLPTFRSLSEAAAAGINPLEADQPQEEPAAVPEPGPQSVHQLPVKFTINEKPEGKSLLPALLGAAGVLASFFVGFLLLMTIRLRRTPTK